MARRQKTSEELRREQEKLQEQIKEAIAREKELAAQIKQTEKAELESRYVSAAGVFEEEAKKLKLDIVFDDETARALAAFAAENGFEV